MHAHAAQQQWISFAIMAGVIVIVMTLRLRRMNRMRPLKLEQLWIIPVLYLVIAALMFVALPPSGLGWLYSGLALAVGAAVGWQRGKMMRISVDPETHALNQKASPAAVIFLVVLILVRSGARMAMQGGGTQISPAMLTDPLIAFALGMFTLQRIEMYLRAKRLLDEARGLPA